MGNLIVDTVKLKESGEDIIILTKELKEELDALFTRITNMNTRTYEWVGPASQDFIRRTNIEKIQYNKIINSLNKYGKALIEVSDRYDTYINKLRWFYD